MGFPLSDLRHLRVALECPRESHGEPRKGRLGVGVARKHLRSLRLAEAVGPTTPSSPLTSSRGSHREVVRFGPDRQVHVTFSAQTDEIGGCAAPTYWRA